MSAPGSVPAAVPEPALELDCRGMPCPRPVIELARHVGDVAVGEVVAVVATDPASRHDVPAWCRMKGHQHLATTALDDGALRLLVRRLG